MVESPPDPVDPRSTLLFGSDGTAMAILAAALALRSTRSFAWANAAGPDGLLDPAVRSLLAGRSEGAPMERFQPEDFERPEVSDDALGRLVDPESLSAAPRARLSEYFRLPRILQALVARTAPGPFGSSIVITGLEVWPSPFLTSVFLDEATHAVLRSQRVSILATYRGVPSSGLRAAFDGEFEVRYQSGKDWRDALIRPIRTPGGRPLPPEVPLRELWERERLGETLALPRLS